MNSLLQAPEDKEQLKQILSQDEYTSYAQQERSSFWDWLGPVFRKLKSLLPDFDIPQSADSIVTYGLLVLMTVIAIAAIYWFSKQIIRQKRLRTEAYLPAGEMSRSYRAYWQHAGECRDARAWREGVRSLFLTLLFFLEAKRRIRVEKWKTNWEYAGELADSEAALVPLFRDSSLVFERIWYGKEEVTEELFGRMYEQVAQVIGGKEEDKHAWAE